MKAIVCDKCGKVSLLEDDGLCRYPSDVYRLVTNRRGAIEIDLCEDCAGELVELLRRTDGDANE